MIICFLNQTITNKMNQVTQLLLSLCFVLLTSCHTSAMDTKVISDFTIKTPNYVVGCIFSDDGNEFMYWSEKVIHIYSIKDNVPVLIRTIPYKNDYKYNATDFDVYRCLFDSIDKVPDSFKGLKIYALNAKNNARSGDIFPIIRYNDTIGALQRAPHWDEDNFYFTLKSKKRIYLDKDDNGTSHDAMSSLDLNTWWIQRTHFTFSESKPPCKIPMYHIWKNRNGRLSSFAIQPSEVGISNNDIGIHTAYITPSGRYVILLYGTDFIHLSGRYPEITKTIKYLIDSIFKSQKFYLAVIDTENEKVIYKKQFSRYTNYFPNYQKEFAICEKKNIYALWEDSTFKFYRLPKEIKP